MLPQRPYPVRARQPVRPNPVQPPQPVLAAGEQSWISDVNNPARRMGLNFGLLFTFIQFTKLHELFSMVLHFNSFLLYLVGIPAYALLFMSGGIQRTWQWTQSRYWVGVGIWLMLSVPTSLWIMNSLSIAMVYWRTEIAVLFVIAGFVMTWDECRKLMKVLAWSAVVDLLAGRMLSQLDSNGRLELSGGTMANANDYAALLILVLPFLLLVVLTSRNPIIRVLAFISLLIGLYMTLATGSRGGMVALMVGLLYGLWRLTLPQKVMGIAVIGLVGTALLFMLPDATRMRLATAFTGQSQMSSFEQQSAVESANAREHILKDSVIATFAHPLFGVGIDQFENYEGTQERKRGLVGTWNTTHNAYTQISSEAGIPAFLFFIAGIISTFLLMNRTYRKARKMPRSPKNIEIEWTCFVVLLSMVSFSACVFFLSLAYRFYLPAFTGIAIALSRATEHEWNFPDLPQLQPVTLAGSRFL